MSWGRKKSRISLRNLLRNKKTAVIAAVCCVVAVGAYIGLHRPTSQAGNENTVRGILNGKVDGDKMQYYTKSYAASSDAEKSTIPLDMSTKTSLNFSGLQVPNSDNPFVVLELVPWQGFCEMGYMIEGCEPMDVFTPAGVYDKKKAAYYRSLGKEAEKQYNSYLGTTGGLEWANMGAIVKKCFPEEDYPGKGVSKDSPDYKYRWMEKKNGITLYGYYEKVAGTEYASKGLFNISGLDADGNPTFVKVGEGETGDFIWVSLGDSKPALFDDHVRRENKHFDQNTSTADIVVAYAPGDRCYTQRKTLENESYYAMDGSGSYAGEDGKDHNDIVPKSKFVHYNDFLRYSLRIRTQYEIDHFSVLVKPVDSQHLNANPEYIDYADLIYIHISSESGIANSGTVKAARENMDPKQVLDDDLLDGKSTATEDSTFYTQGNDISWEVAERLYFKANGLTKYEFENGMVKDDPVFDYSGSDGGYSKAPVIIAKALIDTIKGGDAHKDPSWYLDYDTMTLHDSGMHGTQGRNNNFYKFCLMDLLMDPDVFYDLFYQPLDSTGQPVIQTVNGEGIHSLQKGDAQTFWCPEAFLPYVDGSEDGTYDCNWGSNTGKETLEKYDIYMYGGAFLNFQNSAIRHYTYIYNSDGKIFVLGSQANLDKNADSNGGAFDWFEKERDEQYDELPTLDIIYFLLNYEKGGNNSTGSRTKQSIRSLEIEPCNEFYLTETSMRALFPASQYKMKIEPPVHMTTAEFNGSHIDLSDYDLVYIGSCDGKFNMDAKGVTQYNDPNLTAKLYMHVGDTVKDGDSNYRLAGTDITKAKRKKLKDYADSGNAMVLADLLYFHKLDQYQNGVDISSNMDALITGDDITSKSNVISLTKLKTSKKKIISTEVLGAPISITGPTKYTEDKKEDAKISGNKLTFKFSLGYPGKGNENWKYGVRLYVDSNGDGVVSDGEDGSDLCTWESDAKSGMLYDAAAEEDQVKEYSISYTIDKERRNGAIAWKFEVFCVDNPNIRKVVSGVSRYVGNKKDDKAVQNEINVLQIISKKDFEDSAKSNLEEELKKAEGNSLFSKYAKGLDDYNITVKTIPLETVDKTTGYLDEFKRVNAADYSDTSGSRETFSSGGDYYYPSEFMEYSVYLFSCGEELEKADNSNGAVSFASWLSENGRSVVYTTNSIYDAGDAGVNGVAKRLKDSAGLSRYTSTSESTQDYNDVATYAKAKNKTGYAKAVYSSGDYNGYKNLEYTYNQLADKGKENGNQYLPFRNGIWKKKDGSDVAYGSGIDSTDTISQVNNGTVCVYPYTITDPSMDVLDRLSDKTQVPISNAVSQDYQLNLENDMANVWYCLSGKEDTTYGISPNDAWNNYYLYSLDNVYYDNISLDSAATTKMEMKLFINTLIGAYEASYKYPYITADKLELLETPDPENTPAPEELKFERLECTDEEWNYKFSVSGVTTKFIEDYRYKEYVAGASEIAQSSAAPPTPTPTPVATPKPTKDPNATPAPSPVTLLENTTNISGQTWYIDWSRLQDVPDDAQIQFTYHTTEKVTGAPSSTALLRIRTNDTDNYGQTLYACAAGSTDSTQHQAVIMTMKSFKDSFAHPNRLNATDTQQIVIESQDVRSVLTSVRLFSSSMNAGDYEFDDVSKPDVSSDPRETELGASEKAVRNTDTHKIYFTPHDGNLVGGDIKRVKLEFVEDKYDNSGTTNLKLPINEVFREKKTASEEKTFKIVSKNNDGQFAKADNKHLIDSVQYFIPFNKSYVNKYKYIKMTIWNKKRSSVTYIEINSKVVQKKDTKDVYMFNLD